MNLELVTAVLNLPTEMAIRALLDDQETVFWIDWRQEDESIAESCEAVLQTGSLSGKLVEVDTDEGYEVYLQYRNKRVKVPLSYRGEDRHITLCSLNEVLAPEFEIRFCIDSNGSDALAFLPLECGQWAELERQYFETVSKRFYKFGRSPNLFTDPSQF